MDTWQDHRSDGPDAAQGSGAAADGAVSRSRLHYRSLPSLRIGRRPVRLRGLSDGRRVSSAGHDARQLCSHAGRAQPDDSLHAVGRESHRRRSLVCSAGSSLEVSHRTGFASDHHRAAACGARVAPFRAHPHMEHLPADASRDDTCRKRPHLERSKAHRKQLGVGARHAELVGFKISKGFRVEGLLLGFDFSWEQRLPFQKMACLNLTVICKP